MLGCINKCKVFPNENLYLCCPRDQWMCVVTILKGLIHLYRNELILDTLYPSISWFQLYWTLSPLFVPSVLTSGVAEFSALPNPLHRSRDLKIPALLLLRQHFWDGPSRFWMLSTVTVTNVDQSESIWSVKVLTEKMKKSGDFKSLARWSGCWHLGNPGGKHKGWEGRPLLVYLLHFFCKGKLTL